MQVVPDFITHYSRGEPFRSITGLAPSERQHVLKTLNETNAWGLNRFQDPEYLVKRIETERKIRSEFEKAGGCATLAHPIYFFLGTNLKFEEHSANRAYKISLRNLPDTSVSFTYGDSLLAFDEAYRKLSGERYQNPLCEKVFLKNDLRLLFSSPDYPEREPLHIEAQLWVNPASIFFYH